MVELAIRAATDQAAERDAWQQAPPTRESTPGDAKHLRDELRLAAEFQRAVLPEFPAVGYLRVALRYLPCDGVSGDVYDFVLNREGEISVFVGDATGHGVTAALMTMMIHMGLDSLRPDLPTDEALRRLNGLLAARSTGRSISAVYFRVTPGGHLTVTHAGHPSLLVVPANAAAPASFEQGGCALGMFADEPVPYAQESLQLHDGDKLVVYTDGLTEWQSPRGDRFGPDRLARALVETRTEPVAGMLEALFSRVRDFSDGQPHRDDVTVLCFEYRQRATAPRTT